ncbi:uncharacterized protein METZ01_LOCUS504382, partial [marine metagenome]
VPPQVTVTVRSLQANGPLPAPPKSAPAMKSPLTAPYYSGGGTWRVTPAAAPGMFFGTLFSTIPAPQEIHR